MPNRHTCPNCGADGMDVFYRLSRVPAHSVLLFNSPQEAVSYPRGDIELAFCRTCGFIANVTFDPTLHRYSARYEATQGYSPTFNIFHRQLAADLVERHTLRRKTIIEIGCGQGEFLHLLCQLGDNRGLGFDPAFTGDRSAVPPDPRVTVISDFYSEKYAHHRADFICCKMTLEHIPQTARLVQSVRRSIGAHADTVVFFQVPDVTRILRQQAFWDIYYEHCSYFSPHSLAFLFRRCGFEVLNVSTGYDNQYLMIEARPVPAPPPAPPGSAAALAALAQDVALFVANCPPAVEAWRRSVRQINRQGKRTVIWGGGSKAVAFLTTLNLHTEIDCIVDINPHKHNTYLAGTGHKIVAPAALKNRLPEVVIVMNPIYRDEIARQLEGLGLSAKLKPV